MRKLGKQRDIVEAAFYEEEQIKRLMHMMLSSSNHSAADACDLSDSSKFRKKKNAKPKEKRNRIAWPLSFLNDPYVKHGHAVPSACGMFVTCKDCNKRLKMRRPFEEHNFHSHCGDKHAEKVAKREMLERRIREGKEK